MTDFLHSLTSGTVLTTGVMVLVVAFIALLRIISNNYIKVPPNRVAVFYGRKRRTREGAEVAR